MSIRVASLCVLALLALSSCDSSSGVDAGIDASIDAGVIDCELDPLASGCVPTERPAFPGLSADVEIARDADGVPHVYGANAADTMYGAGYAQAFDRLFQMDLARRRALGRRAEVLGPGFVEGDRLVRIVDIPRWGRTNEAALFRDAPDDWILLQAWIEGVNARIDEVLSGAAQLPQEFVELGYRPERWTPSDALSFGKLMLFGNANQIEYTLLAQILEQYVPAFDEALSLLAPFRDSYVLPPEERPESARATSTAGPSRRALPPDARDRLRRWQRTMRELRPGASNNWAIDGRHTNNGRPLIAGDPHQPLQSPSLFWMHHMSAADGSLDVVGWSFVGGPTVSLGHNRHVAWTATTTYPDMMDLWDVRVSDGSAMVAGRLVSLHYRNETLLVAGGEPVELEIEEVPGFGVLLPDDFAPLPVGRPGRRLLFRWTGFGVTHEFEGFLGFDRARSRDEFETAVDRIELGAFNFVSADADGISYRVGARVPVRGEVSDRRRPYLILDGDDPETYWSGSSLSPELLPHSRGGERGWLASANNDPYGFVADGAIEGDPFYYGVFFDPGVRSARLESEVERLVSDGDVDVSNMQALQDDTYTLYADDLVPILEQVWASRTTDPLLAELADRDDLDALVTRLSAWDRRMERTSGDAVIFNAYLFFLASRVLRDDLSVVFDAIIEAETAFVFKWLCAALRDDRPFDAPPFVDEPRQVSVLRALETTAAWLGARFPDGDYDWADLHGTVFRSLHGARLEAAWTPTDGGCGTINRADAVFLAEGAPTERLESSDGSIYRMVASFRSDGTPEAFFTMGRGVSGEPDDPHYDDLQDDWIEMRYRRLRFLREEVESDPFEALRLTP